MKKGVHRFLMLFLLFPVNYPPNCMNEKFPYIYRHKNVNLQACGSTETYLSFPVEWVSKL